MSSSVATSRFRLHVPACTSTRVCANKGTWVHRQQHLRGTYGLPKAHPGFLSLTTHALASAAWRPSLCRIVLGIATTSTVLRAARETLFCELVFNISRLAAFTREPTELTGEVRQRSELLAIDSMGLA